MVQGRGPLRTHDLWALRPTPRSLCGAGSPCSHRCEGRCPSGASRQTWLFAPRSGGWRPPHPHEGALRPSTPGDFPVAGKVTKGAPGAAPLAPRCGVTALFALAALRSGSRRAAFCHKNRPICHFEVVGESVLLFPLVLRRKDFVLLIRGAGVWVARLGATLGAIRGIGEGVWCGASGSSVQFVQVCAAPVQQQMA